MLSTRLDDEATLTDDSCDVDVDSSTTSRCWITSVLTLLEFPVVGIPRPEIGIRREISTIQAF